MREVHKSHLQKTFQHLIEGVPNQGDARPLHEIYTELYITEGGRGEVNDEHEVRQIEKTSWREAARGRPIKCSDIFKRLSGQDKPIRVLTKGVAGIGKTVSVQKFILDWTEGKANQDVHFIFPLLFRELNLMREKKLSLVDLIQHFVPGMKDPTVFSSSQNRVMFILDGLDECRLPLDFRSNPRCCDVTKPAPVDVLLTNLIKGNLLPSALLWITTRPAAANQIPPECVDQVSEIRGFNNPQKEEYFRKRISDENLASRTITHLKSSRSLYIMCHIPVFCWITATVVERTSDESGKVEMPRTLTQMYTHFLIIQTSTKKEKYTERKETDEEMIFKLGKLAFQQLEQGNLIFYEEDLRECGIDVTEASVYSGVCTQIFREESGLYQGKVFSFVHLSIQEFLAALYVFLSFSNRERDMPDQQQTSQLSGLFRAASLHDLHKTAVDLALESKNGHLDLFLRFLLGLSLESNQNLLRHLLPQTRSQSQSSEQTAQFVKQMIRDQNKQMIRDQETSDRRRNLFRDQNESHRRINLFYCLNELNQHAVVEVINRGSGALSVEMLLPGEWETRTFKFEISEEQLDEFDLQKYIKTPEEDQTELLSPDDVLQKLLPGVTTAFCQLGPINVQMHEVHKSHLQKMFQHLIEGVPNQGDARPLHEIYTELYITQGGRGWVNDEHEVRQIERASWREAAQDRPIKCCDIFKRLLEDDRRREEDLALKNLHRQDKPKPIRVLTKGVAGIGKTVSVQKFILDWTEGKANQDVHFIFPLLFRELNLMREKKLCLVDLIQHFIPRMKDPTVFSSSQNKVMFILDGLDECRLPLDFRSNPRCCDVTEPAPVDVLLTNLIKGNLLPSALLWITTRPAAANQIPPECVDQVTEIRGFNDPQKEEYFRKRISDENLASRTITHLKSSRSLYIMCHIPVFCWISAIVAERTSDESGKVEMPRTLTQMYTHFLIIQTSTKKEKYTERKETDEEMIFKLGKLAFQQLEQGNLIFYEEDLRECGIDVTEASVYSGVCTQIFREEAGLNQVKVFSFVHLSIQEFLAALFVFLCFSNRERNMPDQQQTSQLSGLFRAATLHDLHETAVDLALQSGNGHLDLFLRFLLGLSLESNQNLLRHLLPQTRSQSQSSEQTFQYVKHKIRDQRTSDRRINLFYCLNELNQHAVVEVIDRSSGTLSVDVLLPGQWKTGTFKLKISEEQLDEFDLQKYIKTPEEDQTELLSPDDVLQKLVPVVKTSTSAS
ncbi:uncharacterized protein LOC105912341 [Clupea harengus]|uniref:Uncharacterized protein LOC105912341 n=1 Tax=Clupea harengus TaxID=7950 RepID=A0A8M1KBE5_CLUHA|nr:uncharacterized protein LOC105912341 [Clupea harengus]